MEAPPPPHRSGRNDHLQQPYWQAPSARQSLQGSEAAVPNGRPRQRMAAREDPARRATEQLERQQDQRDLMRHWVDELSEFAPEEGEFDALIEQRRHARETKSLRASNVETIIGSIGACSRANEPRSIALQTQESEPLHELLSRADQAIDGYLRHLQLCTADLCDDRRGRHPRAPVSLARLGAQAPLSGGGAVRLLRALTA